MFHLYVKTHNITGLKYLGKTTQDPYRYVGSGIRWKRHLNKYGYDVHTHVLGSYETVEELKSKGLLYSEIYNIVESNDWANLVPEDGHGGSVKGREISTKHRKNLSKSLLGNKNRLGFKDSIETKKKKSLSNKGILKPGTSEALRDVPKSSEHKLKLSLSLKNKPWSQNRRNAQQMKVENRI